jgi:hypothetical protein
MQSACLTSVQVLYIMTFGSRDTRNRPSSSKKTQDDSLVGRRELIIIYKSRNNLPIETKIESTFYPATPAWCLSVRFDLFPSACDATSCAAEWGLWLSSVFFSYTFSGLRCRSNKARRLSETGSVLQHHQRALPRRLSRNYGPKKTRHSRPSLTVNTLMTGYQFLTPPPVDRVILPVLLKVHTFI